MLLSISRDSLTSSWCRNNYFTLSRKFLHFLTRRLPYYFYYKRVLDETAALIDHAPPTAASGVDCVGVAGVIQKTENEQSNALISITRAKNVGRIGSTDVLRIEEVKILNINNPGGEVSKQLNALGKLLSEGEYYFRHGIKFIKKILIQVK